MKTKEDIAGPLRSFVLSFYAARRERDNSRVREMIDPLVRWTEPTVGNHMGLLEGVDAVLDMMSRAQLATGDSFQLTPGESVETQSWIACVINWSAEKNGTVLRGQELAVFGVVAGRIVHASFMPANIDDDIDFWK